MTRILALLLATLLSICLIGCENKQATDTLCAYCNEIIDEADKFCSHCGKAKDGTTIPNNEQNSVNVSEEKEPIIQTAYCMECNVECEIGHSYCKTHECLKSSCIMQAKKGSSWCVAHSCIYCTKERHGNLSWCYSHRCDNCDNAVVGNSDYCTKHKCLMCDKEAWSSGYCSKHEP